MNREQYLAKRMWLHGPVPGSGNLAGPGQPAWDRGASPLPPLSLSEHYRRFHQGAAAGKSRNETPN